MKLLCIITFSCSVVLLCYSQPSLPTINSIVHPTNLTLIKRVVIPRNSGRVEFIAPLIDHALYPHYSCWGIQSAPTPNGPWTWEYTVPADGKLKSMNFTYSQSQQFFKAVPQWNP